MEVGDLISLYRKQAGLTIEELAEKSGVPKGTINKIIGGVTKAPTLPNMKSIARALGKTLADFDDLPIPKEKAPLYSSEAMKLAKDYDELDDWGKKLVQSTTDIELARCQEKLSRHSVVPDNIIPFRRSIQPVSAGTGAYLGPEEFETIFVVDNNLTHHASFGVTVRGDSMEPTYHDGDILIVEGAEDIEVGEIGVFTVGGDGYVKKRGENTLISLNPAYEPIQLTEDTWCNGRVIGLLAPEWIVGK